MSGADRGSQSEFNNEPSHTAEANITAHHNGINPPQIMNQGYENNPTNPNEVLSQSLINKDAIDLSYSRDVTSEVN